LTAIKLCAAFGTCAFIFAAPIGFLTNIVYIMPLLWSLLFFGAALIPTATGVVVNSVSREH
jgi:Kef-type K+ transport system membrane component KefB